METAQQRARRKTLWNNAKLTPEEWEKISECQGHVCFICGKKQKSGKRLATDHDHKTGLIRGLLCSQCNRLLGRIEGAGMTVQMIGRIIEYYTSPPAVVALGREVFGFAGRWGTKRHRAALRRESKRVRAHKRKYVRRMRKA